jgi:hypothetical protein
MFICAKIKRKKKQDNGYFIGDLQNFTDYSKNSITIDERQHRTPVSKDHYLRLLFNCK